MGKKCIKMSNFRAQYGKPLLLLITPADFWRPRFCSRVLQATGSLRNDATTSTTKMKAYVMRKNNSFARTARAFLVLVHFFAVLVKTTGTLSNEDNAVNDNEKYEFAFMR